MAESIHEKLKRIRKPRVHIVYEVDKGDAVIKRELPFVVGVLGDFSGDPTNPLRRLGERRFIEIDRDNFNTVMSRMSPGLKFKVDNTLEDGDKQMSVRLAFNSMEDFEPARVVAQVPPLKKLLEKRSELRDLMAKVDLSDDLEAKLEEVLQNTENLSRISGELGVGGKVETGDNEGEDK